MERVCTAALVPGCAVEGEGAPALPVAFWNETVRFLLAILFSIDDTLIILEHCI